MIENLNYSAGRMTQVWPSRFPNASSAAPYAHNPRALANKVYNGRMGNRAGSDDGWNFRGRGAVQTTGRDGYRRLAATTGLDVVTHPDLVNDPARFLKCGVADFVNCGCLPFARKDDVRGVTKRLNGGYVGLRDREAWLSRWKRSLGSSLKGKFFMLSQIVGPVDFNSAAVLRVAFICLSVVATSLVVKRRSRLLLDQEFDLAKIRTPEQRTKPASGRPTPADERPDGSERDRFSASIPLILARAGRE